MIAITRNRGSAACINQGGSAILLWKMATCRPRVNHSESGKGHLEAVVRMDPYLLAPTKMKNEPNKLFIINKMTKKQTQTFGSQNPVSDLESVRRLGWEEPTQANLRAPGRQFGRPAQAKMTDGGHSISEIEESAATGLTLALPQALSKITRGSHSLYEAKAGIQSFPARPCHRFREAAEWTPAFAGVTTKSDFHPIGWTAGPPGTQGRFYAGVTTKSNSHALGRPQARDHSPERQFWGDSFRGLRRFQRPVPRSWRGAKPTEANRVKINGIKELQGKRPRRSQ